MAKEEKPLEYEQRIADTKGLAQRIDLGYMLRPNWFRDRRRILTRIAPWVAVLGIAPFFFRGTERFYENGPVSRSHAIFAKNCAVCHAQAFASVLDLSCKKCHDGPIHQANATGEARCAACHLEHRGRMWLAEMDDGNCIRCHADLAAHSRNRRTSAVRITAFRLNQHPQFSAAAKPDLRPLRLNHAVHMPTQPKVIRGKKLPIECSDCHATDRQSPKGDLLPVTFEKNCRSCHSVELEFDVYQLLGEGAPPAPHTKDPQTIHDFILRTYQDLYSANPAIIQRPLGRDFKPAPNQTTWLNQVVADSENYLFQRKCNYCHEYEQIHGGYPVVHKVNLIRGRYAPGNPQGEPWLEHATFSHRSHRAVECISCHTTAPQSTKTSDVLIPTMQPCLSCHGSTGTWQDHCVQCHLYHDKSRELDKDRRPIERLTGWLEARPAKGKG